MIDPVPVHPDPSLIEYITEYGDSCRITVEGTGGREAATDGLRTARDRIRSIPHPDEPSDGLPNWCEVEETSEGPVLEFDIKDWGRLYAVDIVDILVESLERAGFVGVVRPAPGAYEDVADGGGEVSNDVLAQFPEPPGARAISTSGSNEMAEKVWRSSVDGPRLMEDLERRLPAAGFEIVYSGEAIGPPDYTGIIAFSGVQVGEVMVRPAAPGTFVKATVYFGEPPWNAAIRAVDDPDMRLHLRFRIPPS